MKFREQDHLREGIEQELRNSNDVVVVVVGDTASTKTRSVEGSWRTLLNVELVREGTMTYHHHCASR